MLVVSRTNKGFVRENNEDSVLVKKPNLFAIADGMGGYRGGETASSKAVEILAKANFANVNDTEILDFLNALVQKAGKTIWELAQSDPQLKGMGTTLTVVYLLDKARACVAHVGDSRVYMLQSTGLKKITSDHSYVAELVRKRQISAEEAESHQHKNIIMRAVGAEPEVEVDLFEFMITGGRRILISSDGLTNMVSETEIEEVLGETELEQAADILMSRALAAGGKDNISFIILGLEE
ncbi:MAG TPA: Stp1/IreP family PP2C-type Ser/Thr phosphatase [Candidatus Avacidaminococcus intestinavium]|uniref:Stp1/IreP family PP2C-type Ser/Thr phosphatase n=1 Tax=Candidatus Avacidaminococcus intestinavium TaxID=2840684 RepID=A0A9D1MNR1_9FIRM|nr:Stp1/IreP family PP2C-type Ser/Thr phosphatase [Candidatus Avacidaminococcus intestinavium]